MGHRLYLAGHKRTQLGRTGHHMTQTTNADGGIAPIFVSVAEAAKALSLSPFTVYQLLDAGEIECRYKGRRRLVVVDSLRAYALALPTEPPAASA